MYSSPLLCGLISLVLLSMFVVPSFGQDAAFIGGQKFQIILLGIPDMSKMPLAPTDAAVWDIDLFDNPASAIKTLKAAGKIVICYFSAGTAEDWRDDYRDFAAADLGKVLPQWPNEKWVRMTSQSIRNIMAKRIKLAADKGCDAIDPDNTGGLGKRCFCLWGRLFILRTTADFSRRWICMLPLPNTRDIQRRTLYGYTFCLLTVLAKRQWP
jgi:hypothetical protein